MTGRLKIAAWCLAWGLLAPLALLSQVRWNRPVENSASTQPASNGRASNGRESNSPAFAASSPAGSAAARLPIDPLWALTLPGQRTAMRSGSRLDGLGLRDGIDDRIADDSDRGMDFERGARRARRDGSKTGDLVPRPDEIDMFAQRTPNRRRASTDRKSEWSGDSIDEPSADGCVDVAPFDDELSVQPEPLPDQFAGRFDPAFAEPPQAPASPEHESNRPDGTPADERELSPETLEIKVVEVPQRTSSSAVAQPGGALREGAVRSYSSVLNGDRLPADASGFPGHLPRSIDDETADNSDRSGQNSPGIGSTEPPSEVNPDLPDHAQETQKSTESAGDITDAPIGPNGNSTSNAPASPIVADPGKPRNNVPSNPAAPEEIDGPRLYVYKPVAVTLREFARIIAPMIAEAAQHDARVGSHARTQAMLGDSGLFVTATPAVHRLLAALLDRLEAASTPARRSSAKIRCLLVRAPLAHSDRVGYDTVKLRQVFPGSSIQRIESATATAPATAASIPNAPGIHAAADDCRVNIIDAGFDAVAAGLKSMGHVEVIADPVLALSIGEWADATLHTSLIDHARAQSLDYQNHVSDSSQAGLAARIRLASITPGSVQLDLQPQRRNSALNGVTNAGYRLKLDSPVSISIPASATAVYGGIFTEELQTIAMRGSHRTHSLDFWNTPVTTAVQTARSEWLLVISAESDAATVDDRKTAKIVPVPLRVNRNVSLASERSKSATAPMSPVASSRNSRRIDSVSVSPTMPRPSAPVRLDGTVRRMAIPVGHQITVDSAASKRSPGPLSPGKSGRAMPAKRSAPEVESGDDSVSDARNGNDDNRDNDRATDNDAQSDSDRVELLPPPLPLPPSSDAP